MTSTYKHPWAKNAQFANLHGYQRQMADFAIEHPKCGLFLPLGSGKAIDDETIIPTPNGQKRVKDIKIGDYLFGRNGKPTKVLATYHHKQKNAYQVVLQDGREFTCCDEHLIPYFISADYKKLTQAQLADIMDDVTENDYVIPYADTVEYPTQNHIIDSYLMGQLLTHKEKLTKDAIKNIIQEKEQILIHIGEISPTTDDEIKYLVEEIQRLNLIDTELHQRFIPTEYLEDSISHREDLLYSLINNGKTTITVKPISGEPAIIKMEFPNAPQMASQIVYLSYSLGYRALQDATENNNVHLRYKKKPKGSKIVNVYPIGKRDMTCFTVDAPDHLFLINDFIVTHNTLTTLEVLWELAPRCQVLIIGPKPVIRATWNDEIAKWKFPLRIHSLIENEKGKKLSPDDRHALYKEVCESKTAAIWLINREMVYDLVENLPKKQDARGKIVPNWPFRMVIIDEAQAFKNPRSKRFKALASVYDQTLRLIELTGTPSPNGLEDIWSLIWLLDRGERLGENITTYRTSYFFPTGKSANGIPIRWVPFSWAEPEIRAKISDITVSLPDIRQNLPDVMFVDHAVQLDPSERKLYQELMKESVLEFADGDEVVAANAAVLQAKLSQLASGAIYVNGTNTEYRIIHSRKVDECLRIIEQAGGPVLIAYYFRSDKEMILNGLRKALDPKPRKNAKPKKENDPKSNVQVFDGSPAMVKRWNDKQIPVMLIQPASAGHGLNLQHGGSTLIWYTLSWNLEYYLQTNGRLHRQGQKETVFIHRLLTERTVDGRIADALNRKNVSQQALLDAIAATIDDV